MLCLDIGTEVVLKERVPNLLPRHHYVAGVVTDSLSLDYYRIKLFCPRNGQAEFTVHVKDLCMINKETHPEYYI